MTQLSDARTVTPPTAEPHRYDRDSVEFGRVVNLSDAVFAIALTLLVLTLDGLEVAGLVSFALAFLLVAQVWWHHHRIVAQLAWFEPGLVALTLAVLAGVALVPLPTSLVGADPGAREAVLPFIGLFAMLLLLSKGVILRAHRLGAWRRPPASAIISLDHDRLGHERRDPVRLPGGGGVGAARGPRPARGRLYGQRLDRDPARPAGTPRLVLSRGSEGVLPATEYGTAAGSS